MTKVYQYKNNKRHELVLHNFKRCIDALMHRNNHVAFLLLYTKSNLSPNQSHYTLLCLA